MRPSPPTRRIVLAGLVWLALLAAGFAYLWSYESAPGAAARAPRSWPSATGLVLDAGVPTLVMFAHPHCPCTRASIGELDRLVASCEGRLAARVVLFAPEEAPPGWERSDLRAAAARIPGVALVDDLGGREATRFGAGTSGAVLVYSPAGRLRFNGGLTVSRGHSGDSDGRVAILRLVNDAGAREVETPAFGCGLSDALCEMDPEPAS